MQASFHCYRNILVYTESIANLIEKKEGKEECGMNNPTENTLQLNGKCLAFHGPLLYEARILKIWNPETKTLATGEGTLKQDHSGDAPSDKLKQEIARIPSEIVNGTCYFIHYQGWKSTWDEWVGAERIRIYNEENMALRNRLVQEAKEAKKTQKQEQRKRKQQQQQYPAGSSSSSSRPSSAQTSKKRHLESGSAKGRSGSSGSKQQEIDGSATKHKHGPSSSSSASSKERSHTDKIESSRGKLSSPSPSSTGRNSPSQQYPFDTSSYNSISQRNVPKITLHIPLKRKSILVDDWELVTKDKKICKLPKPKDQSVTGILDRYKRAATEENFNHSLVMESMLDEYILGLKLYFNECLPRLLLYRLERLQYETILKQLNGNTEVGKESKGSNTRRISPGSALCDIYGSVHLLRLLSLLPELMTSTTMGAQSCRVIIKQSESLLVWMVLNAEELFNTAGEPDADGDLYYVNTSSQYEGVALGM